MHFLVLRRSVLTPIQWSQPCSSVTSLLQFRNNFDYTCIQTHIVQQWPHTVNPTLKTFPLTSVSVTSAARCVSRENTPHKRHQVAEKTGSQRWEVNCDSQRHSWYDTHTHTHRGGKKRGPWFGSFGWWHTRCCRLARGRPAVNWQRFAHFSFGGFYITSRLLALIFELLPKCGGLPSKPHT